MRHKNDFPSCNSVFSICNNGFPKCKTNVSIVVPQVFPPGELIPFLAVQGVPSNTQTKLASLLLSSLLLLCLLLALLPLAPLPSLLLITAISEGAQH